MIPPLFKNQEQSIEKMQGMTGFFDLSEPGTGKTRTHLHDFIERRKKGGGACLIMATKSILQSAWGNDIAKFFPGTSYIIAAAVNRKKAFDKKVDIYITNHDAAAWIAKSPKVLNGIDTLIIDESTAFKNATTQRSKAVKQFAKKMKWVRCLSGTAAPNTILELWHQMLLLDGGQRLGTSFWKFRNVVCEPIQVGPSAEMIDWVDKEGSREAVFSMIEDMSIRHLRKNCTSIPENTTRTVYFDLPKDVMAQYEDMKNHAAMLMGDGKMLSAVHAASLQTKLLQIAAGAVYTGDDPDNDFAAVEMHTGRTDLVLDIVEERPHSIVVFQWRHQRDQLVKAAKARGLTYAYIDGTVKDRDRPVIVDDFQAGKYRVLFVHPKSAAHGLTLTKGTATIWASPTYSSEFYTQANARIDRPGQTEKTETIHICANKTIDEKAYDMLGGKLTRMQLLLTLFAETP